MNSVCIIGGSKTGTTGLYSAVHEAVQAAHPRCYGMFEKYDPDVLANLQRLAPHTPVVAKFLLTNRYFSRQLAETFEKRLLIVRDPRDTLLSAALYYPVLALNKGVDRAAIGEYIDLVREKEQDPASHSFLDLLIAVYRLMGRDVERRGKRFERRFRVVTDFVDRADVFVVRYEDFINDDLDALGDHLGFEVRNTRPSTYSSIVLRSGGSGEWRHWFTPEDVEEFRPVMSGYLRRFGYPDDWSLAAEPSIDPDAGSRYVEGSVDKRRRQIELNQAARASEEGLEQLRQRADEGAVGAATKVARILLDEDPRARDHEIRERLLFAASCGHVPAMRQLAGVLADAGNAHDREEAARWSAEADAEEERERLRKQVADDGRTDPRLERQLVRRRRELKRMRSSKRWRVASVLADAPRRGPRALIRAPLQAWRIARRG